MTESVLSSPTEYRNQLEKMVVRNYERLQQARIAADEADIVLYQDRMNIALESIFVDMGVELDEVA